MVKTLKIIKILSYESIYLNYQYLKIIIDKINNLALIKIICDVLLHFSVGGQPRRRLDNFSGA